MDYIIAGVVTAVALLVIARVLDKAGLAQWWAILFFVPLVNLAAVWALAYARWPKVDGPKEPAA